VVRLSHSAAQYHLDFLVRQISGLRRIRSYEITRSDKRRIAAEIREKPLPITADFDGF
jgi:hypothetical protein